MMLPLIEILLPASHFSVGPGKALIIYQTRLKSLKFVRFSWDVLVPLLYDVATHRGPFTSKSFFCLVPIKH